jgi:hypothetical protein
MRIGRVRFEDKMKVNRECVCGCKHKVVSSDRHFKIVFIVKYECILDRLSGHKQIKAFKE